MTPEEREAFLADLHIGVLAIADGDGAPSAAPIWYLYEPGGEIEFSMSPTSRKAQLLEVGSRVTLVAQREEVPPGYVSVEGVVTSIGEPTTRAFLERLYARYLEPAEAERRSAALPEGETGSVLLRVRPERWRTTDYRKR
jgi:PPOX class probable F420-dependent enzyme